MEEVAEEEMSTEKGKYGCRYMHSFYDPKTGVFDHFDGAHRHMVLPLSRLHDVRGEQSNVPRDNAAHYGAEEDVL